MGLFFLTISKPLKQLAIFNARRIMNLSPKLLDVAHKRLFTKPSILIYCEKITLSTENA